jgi:hypothetical protein
MARSQCDTPLVLPFYSPSFLNSYLYLSIINECPMHKIVKMQVLQIVVQHYPNVGIALGGIFWVLVIDTPSLQYPFYTIYYNYT